MLFSVRHTESSQREEVKSFYHCQNAEAEEQTSNPTESHYRVYNEENIASNSSLASF